MRPVSTGGVLRRRIAHPARVFIGEEHATAAFKAGSVKHGDVMVLIGLVPGCGMSETYQVTATARRRRGLAAGFSTAASGAEKIR